MLILVLTILVLALAIWLNLVPSIFGFIIGAILLAHLLFSIYSHFKRELALHFRSNKYDPLWAGRFKHLAGLKINCNEEVFLFYLRNQTLLLEYENYKKDIDIEAVANVYVLKYKEYLALGSEFKFKIAHDLKDAYITQTDEQVIQELRSKHDQIFLIEYLEPEQVKTSFIALLSLNKKAKMKAMLNYNDFRARLQKAGKVAKIKASISE